jgi:hypothetical protein
VEFERQHEDAADVPMNREQVASFGTAREAVSNTVRYGDAGMLGMWIVVLLFVVPGVFFGSWILIGIGVLVAIPTAIASFRRYRNRKMWEQAG